MSNSFNYILYVDAYAEVGDRLGYHDDVPREGWVVAIDGNDAYVVDAPTWEQAQAFWAGLMEQKREWVCTS